MSEPRTCPYCGSELLPDARFCSVCGQPVSIEPEQSLGSMSEQPPPPVIWGEGAAGKARRFPWVAVVGFVVGLAIIGGVIVTYPQLKTLISRRASSLTLTPVQVALPSIPLTAAITETPEPGAAATASPLPSVTPQGVPTNTPPGPTSTPTEEVTATPTPTEAPTSTPAPSVPEPRVLSISASPATVRFGDMVTIQWQAQGEHVVLVERDLTGEPVTEHPVEAAGSVALPVAVLAPGELRYSVFAMTGDHWDEGVTSVQVTCQYAWFMADRPAACPAEEAVHTAVAAQRFERGLTFWIKEGDRILILYADGRTPRWEEQPNAWFEGMQEWDPAIVPPAGLYQPKRGFGVAWRETTSANGMPVRDRLGWALEEEFLVDGGTIQCGLDGVCFITGPESQIYALRPDGADWAIWTGS